MAVSKSQKIQAEIDKVKAKISEQQARLKELEKNRPGSRSWKRTSRRPKTARSWTSCGA